MSALPSNLPRRRSTPPDEAFYRRPTEQVARELLGMVLLHETSEGVTAGRIVETEAYTGAEDPASHAARGPRGRNLLMFNSPGHAYVYFIYGNHFCFNAVAFDEPPGAVLVRALEPLEGIPLMAARRALTEGDLRLSNGPGKLAQALGIARGQNGAPLFDTRSALRIESDGPQKGDIVVSPRIGIRQAADMMRRFHLAGNSCVSRR
ncbi:MAG: DNA-3-methyladenine glycosylase [Armatimonadetes bacterium]|nr:DNA-3-methyladenine glycosylase [Armatimonadota bacterium]